MNAGDVLGPWANFFVIVGSAAAALTGLMFVVVTLIFDASRVRRSPDGIGTFSTPTVAHFAGALLVAAVLAAPWRTFTGLEIVLGLAGLAGIGYIVRTGRRAHTMQSYTPDADDWLWYTVLPLLAYAGIFGDALLLPTAPQNAMFGFGGGALMLIFVGIHNSWDIVTYLAMNPDADDTDES